MSLVVYGLDLWPYGINELSLWNDSDSWFKLLKNSSYIIYIFTEENLPYGRYVSRMWQVLPQTAS
jgi:hypothetical protein